MIRGNVQRGQIVCVQRASTREETFDVSQPFSFQQILQSSFNRDQRNPHSSRAVICNFQSLQELILHWSGSKKSTNTTHTRWYCITPQPYKWYYSQFVVFHCQMESTLWILTDDGDHARLGDFAKLVARYYLVLAVIFGICLHHLQLGFTRRRWIRHFPVLARLELGRIIDEPRHGDRFWTSDFQRKFNLLELINRLQKISQRCLELTAFVVNCSALSNNMRSELAKRQ